MMVQFAYDNRTAPAPCLVETCLAETCFGFVGGDSTGPATRLQVYEQLG